MKRPPKEVRCELTDSQYISANESMWSGPDETVIECRSTKLVTVRKIQKCMCPACSEEAHIIPIGHRAVRDHALADGTFGTCYVCLPCLASWWNHCEYGDDYCVMSAPKRDRRKAKKERRMK